MRSIIFLTLAVLAMFAGASAEKKVVCYYENWARYRPGVGQFDVENINPKLCTHLIYAFTTLNDDFTIKISDPWADIDSGGYAKFNALRMQNPGLKTLVAVGGWNEGSKKFSPMASKKSTRKIFIDSVVALLEQHKFNGLDVDWEYPSVQDGSTPADKKNFIELLKELKAAFNGKYLLTVAVGVTDEHIATSYDLPAMFGYVDFINLMTYDLHTAGEKMTGLHSALYPDPSETGRAAKLNIDVIVKYWISQGAPKDKLILGMPTYGRSFRIEPNGVSVGAKAVDAGTAGPITRENGFLSYLEICLNEKNDKWQVKFDEKRRTPYAYKGDQWVGFDNVKSIREKAEYVKKNGLGGAMVWAIDNDDFNGVCGTKWPLLTTINKVLRDGQRLSVNEVDSDTKFDDESDEEPDNESDEDDDESDEDPSTSDEDGSDEDIFVPHQPAPGNVPAIPSPIAHDGICREAGNMPDPETPTRYIACVSKGDGTFIAYPMPCPDGLHFNPQIGVCDYPNQI